MDDSDEELQSINNVALLDPQLKQAGCLCDENLCVHIFRDLDGIKKFHQLLCVRCEQ
jgi:hypothetical protein